MATKIDDETLAQIPREWDRVEAIRKSREPERLKPVPEAHVIINGVVLDYGQSMALRVAVAMMQSELENAQRVAALGPIGPLYKRRLNEIMGIMVTR